MLARDAAHGGVEVLLIRRSPELRFMGGVYVFPGGAVHAQDESAELHARVARDVAAWGHGADRALDRTYALAAIRETCEEVGVLLGVQHVTSEQLAHARSELLAGAALAAALAAFGAMLDLAVLAPLSRWITPARQTIRFDTRFYVTPAPADQHPTPEQGEIVDAVWRSPERAVEEHQAKTLTLSPPTYCTLEDVIGIRSVAELIAYANSRPPPCIEPVSATVDGKNMILFPGDPEHPVRERALRGPTRRFL